MKLKTFKEMYDTIIKESTVNAFKYHRSYMFNHNKSALHFLFKELSNPNPILFAILKSETTGVPPESCSLDNALLINFWKEYYEQNKFQIFKSLYVIYKYKDQVLSGYFSSLSDSELYIKINDTWYDKDDVTIVDTNEDEVEQLKEGIVIASDETKLSESVIFISQDIKENFVLYKIEAVEEILEGVVNNVSPNNFYIQIGDRWHNYKQIKILEILEEKIKSNRIQKINQT